MSGVVSVDDAVPKVGELDIDVLNCFIICI